MVFELGIDSVGYLSAIRNTTRLFNRFFIDANMHLGISNREKSLSLYFFLYNTFFESFYHHIALSTKSTDELHELLIETLKVHKRIQGDREHMDKQYRCSVTPESIAKKFNISENSIIDFGFGIRHQLFTKLKICEQPGAISIEPGQIKKLTEPLEIMICKRVAHEINNTNLSKLDQEMKFSIINILNELIKFTEYDAGLFPNCRTILSSAHGWVSSSLIRFILGQSKAYYNNKIIILQAGLIHQSGEDFPQVIWEKMICEKWLSWSNEPGIMDDKCEFFGSPYIGDLLTKKSRVVDQTNIILPQVPFSIIRRPFPFYWQLSFNEFNSQTDNLLANIDRAISIAKNPVLRIKKCDEKYYQTILRERYPDIRIDSGDVNNGEFFEPSVSSYITYFSTALSESAYYSEYMELLFDNRDTFLDKKIYNEGSEGKYSLTEIRAKAIRYVSLPEMEERIKEILN